MTPAHETRRFQRSYRTVLRRRRWTILLVFLACAAAGAVAVRLAPPQYTATSLLALRQVERSRNALASSTGYEPSVVVSPMSGENYVEMLRGYDFATRVSARLRAESLELPPGEVRRRLDSSLPEENLIKIEARDRRSDVAARLANTAAALVVEENLQSVRAEMAAAVAHVQEKLKLVRGDIGRVFEELGRLKHERGIGDPVAERTSLLRRLEDYERQRIDHEAKLQKAQARLAGLSPDPEKPIPRDTLIVRDPKVGAARARLIELRGELLDTEARFGPDHPTIANVREEIAGVEASLAARVRELRADAGIDTGPEAFLEIDDQLLSDRVYMIEGPAVIGAYEEAVRRTIEAYRAIPDAEAALESHLVAIDLAKERVRTLSDRADDLEIARELTSGNLSVLSLAAPPKASIPLWVKVVFVLSLSLVFAVGAGFLHEHLDGTVYDAEEVEELLGTAPLATLPRIWGRADRLVRTDRPDAPAAEPARRLLARLRIAARERPFRTLLVCGATPGNGATTVAANLARVAAGFEGRVLLVEADLRVPRLAERLGLGKGPGLADVLAGSARLEEALRPGGHDRLLVLPAGHPVSNPAEVLASSRMRGILTELAGRADLIVVDAPAILAASETAPLAATADAALLVARVDAVPRDALRRARALLAESGVRLLGVALNGTSPRATVSY